jgi:hypothetical protein
MRLLERLFQIISKIAPTPRLSEKEAELLASLNPDKFYVENVRSILNVSHAAAVQICEAAVRQGLFERRVEVMCPDGAVAASAQTESDLPETVRCWHEEDGLLESEDLPTKQLEKTTFYRLHEGSDSVPYGQTA